MEALKISPAVQLIEKYIASGRLPQTYITDIANVIEASTLRIGIVGKMKAGKSSLANALFFQKEVLPTGIKPMTVTLTEIIHGDKDCVTVELLSSSEVEDLKSICNEQDNPKKKEAEYIIKQINKSVEAQTLLSDGIKEVNGIDICDLHEYVADGGRLSGIAKRVIIHTTDPIFKGISIVDTPGFNDPVTSRGEATKSELSKCHVLLFVHDISDQYESTELNLVREQIAFDGISQLIDIVNKIDKLDISEYPIRKWPEYVKSFINDRAKAVSMIEDNALKELIINAPCLHFSPLMALIGYERPMSEDTSNMFCDFREDFEEINNQDDVLKYSNVNELIQVINNLANKREQLLQNGPHNTVLAKLRAIEICIHGEIEVLENKIKALELSQNDIEEKKENLKENIKTILNFTQNTMLGSELLNLVSESLVQIQGIRNRRLDNDYSESIFRDPKLFGDKVKKQNNGLHNNVLTAMCNDITNSLNALKGDFDRVATEHINATATQMIQTTLSPDNRKDLEIALRQSLKQVIANIEIIMSLEQITSTPTGKLKASDLYKADFSRRFSDEKINEYLNPFRGTASRITEEYRKIANEKINGIYTSLSQMASYDPSLKEQEKQGIAENIKMLEKELQELQNDMNSLK